MSLKKKQFPKSDKTQGKNDKKEWKKSDKGKN